MKRILVSAVLIGVVSTAAAVGGTGAFFKDAETSTGNTFAAGALDLTVDNESYYNLNKCANVSKTETPEWQWVGSAAYPVPGTPCTTSWNASDLGNGLLFFNFTDLKPDDEGEDTISLHVNNNNAYACMDVTLTSNDDKSSNEPELGAGDAPEDVNNTWDGELAQNIQMFWWADDGDNVYEVGEQALSQGVQTLYDLATTTPFSVALADSAHNAWTGATTGSFIPGNTTVYVAKSFCFGTLTPQPIVQDGQGNLGTNGPQARGTGFDCNGNGLGNKTQTDGATLDVAFRAVQSRNNPNFLCGGQPRIAKITVTKIVVNDNGGNNLIPDFQLFVDNGILATAVTSGITTQVAAGNYTVFEDGVTGYEGTYGGDCSAEGKVTLNPGDDKHCTITNDDLPSNIHLLRNVVNDNPTHPDASNGSFIMKIDGTVRPNNSSTAVTSNAPHSIDADPVSGYTRSISGDAKCPAVVGGNTTLDEGEVVNCTITYDEI